MSTAMQVVQAPIFQVRFPEHRYRLHGTVEHPGETLQQWVTLFVESDTTDTPPYVRSPIPLYVTKIDSQRADSVTGEWEFQYLDPSRRYTALVYDKDETHDPVMKIHLVPEPM